MELINYKTDKIESTELDFVEAVTSKYDCIYYAKMYTKKTALPYFSFKYKNGDKCVIKETVEPSRAIKGKLLKIEFRSFTWENEEIKTINFSLESESGKNLVILSCPFTGTLRAIINSILKYPKQIEFLKIELTRNNSTGYNNVRCFFNNETEPGKWLYSSQEFSTYYDKVTINKKEVYDDSRLNEFFEDELKKHLSVVCPQHLVTKIVEEETASDEIQEPTDEEVFGIREVIQELSDIPNRTKSHDEIQEISRFFDLDDVDVPKIDKKK